jgi:hypothetical protein
VSKIVEPDAFDLGVEGDFCLEQEAAQVGGGDGLECLPELSEQGRVNYGGLVLGQPFRESSFL